MQTFEVGPKCGCDEYPECTHALYWYEGFKAGTAELDALRATLMDLVKEWNAKAEGPVPTNRTIAYAICAEKLFNALSAERKAGT
jgi:hypothetical protein